MTEPNPVAVKVAGKVVTVGMAIVALCIFALLAAPDPNNPVCNGQRMSQGDVCVTHSSDGSRRLDSYDDLRSDDTGIFWWGIAGGAVVATGGLLALIRAHRRPRGYSQGPRSAAAARRRPGGNGAKL
ncbi:hypothetical protein [Kitasatospora sp. MAA4]|uniref:hypothetical protein n=1 Tax=Kitasatospora sp. MAA4 TaxID=3035093 RepID=UPI002474B7F5|nr:hypothetical protein [Kitasatospora sp. MAA4]